MPSPMHVQYCKSGIRQIKILRSMVYVLCKYMSTHLPREAQEVRCIAILREVVHHTTLQREFRAKFRNMRSILNDTSVEGHPFTRTIVVYSLQFRLCQASLQTHIHLLHTFQHRIDSRLQRTTEVVHMDDTNMYGRRLLASRTRLHSICRTVRGKIVRFRKCTRSTSPA